MFLLSKIYEGWYWLKVFCVCYEWSSVEMKAYFTHQAISHAFCNTVNMLHLSHFSILDRLQHLCCPCLKDARVPSHIHVDSHTHTRAQTQCPRWMGINLCCFNTDKSCTQTFKHIHTNTHTYQLSPIDFLILPCHSPTHVYSPLSVSS